ncbi:hypothetical protein GF406_04565 [candidate division KSB1 bacterium]|nr:hypothetical protein [candidate division KSB1 bacterium]
MAIGIISVRVTASARLVTTKTRTWDEKNYYTEEEWKVNSINENAVIETIYKKAVDMNADAIVDLSIEYFSEPQEYGS